jgi:DNA-binding response OmpR family regulator
VDGLEATLVIPGKPGTQPVIIALTASAIKGDEEACLKLGMNDHMSKLLKIEELVSKLEIWANNARLYDALFPLIDLALNIEKVIGYAKLPRSANYIFARCRCG